jgi:rhodanese-related sulfurtransferase
MQQIYPAQIAEWASQQDQRPVLLDVREGWEVQTASAQPEGMDLLHMPMQTIPARLHELDKTRPIACLCHHGGRSMQVASFLQARGFAHVANIAGGIDAWSVELDTSVPRY